MTDKNGKKSSAIDKANKVSATPDFDVFRFWLKQQRRREKLEAKATQGGKDKTEAHSKSRLK